MAGYHTEYGSFKFSMFMMAEYLHMVVGAAVVATLFFGGWQGPYLADGGFLFPGGAAVALPPAPTASCSIRSTAATSRSATTC